MMIRKLLPLTNAELEAKQAKPGLRLILEILVFFAVYLVASVAEGLVVACFSLIYMIADPSLLDFVIFPALNALDKENAIVSLTKVLEEKLLLPSLFATALLIVIILIFCKFLQKRNMPSLGFRKKGAVSEYLLGLFIGAGMFALAVVVAGKNITITANAASLALIAAFFLGFLIQGMSEEVLCRGYFMLSIARRGNIAVAILINSLAFGLLHLPNNGFSLLALCNVVLFGIFASIWFVKRGSIWGVAAIHSAWNFVQGCVFGISVSGMPQMPSFLHTSLATGKAAELWNGGNFGLEGGLAVTVVLIAFCILALLMPANKNEMAVPE